MSKSSADPARPVRTTVDPLSDPLTDPLPAVEDPEHTVVRPGAGWPSSPPPAGPPMTATTPTAPPAPPAAPPA